MRAAAIAAAAAAVLHCTSWSLVSAAALRPSVQKPLLQAEASSRGRKLTGRFLHITDIHPDPHYRLYSSTDEDSACHRHRGPAGFYGAETSDCDSPMTLVNSTFHWIKHNLRDEIDFIVWTGDSARHDNDNYVRRNERDILDMNQMLVDQFKAVFGRHDKLTIPIVPSLGNNDLLPHNTMEAGPNRWTRWYADMWKEYIPKDQRDDFHQGGWFYVEVVPDKLAVFSLNTMYFFDSNEHGGCASSGQPGYKHFEWLQEQLDSLRARGVKAIFSGHVPPARNDEKSTYFESCWHKYTLWTERYRDVIIGGLYGHMNIEHFLLQDFNEIDIDAAMGAKDVISENQRVEGKQRFEVKVKTDEYLLSLRQQWAELPSVPKSLLYDDWPGDDVDDERSFELLMKHDKAKEKEFLDAIGGKYAERFSVSHVSASVVPNAFPSLRVFEYNITGLEDLVVPEWDSDQAAPRQPTPASATNLERSAPKSTYGAAHMDDDFAIPDPPSSSSPPGPAYSPQPLSWTRYTQLFSNLTYINNDFLAATAHTLPDYNDEEDNIGVAGWDPGRNHGNTPRWPPPLPNAFSVETEYDTMDRHDPYRLKHGLFARGWVELAARIGDFDPDKGDRLLDSTTGSSSHELDDGHDDEEDGVGVDKKKKKKKRKHKKRRIINRTWYAFVSRAEVGVRSADELHARYGQEVESDSDSD